MQKLFISTIEGLTALPQTFESVRKVSENQFDDAV
jgi:hypothetical protein